MKYELVVTWDSGEIDVYEYASQERAERAAQDMKIALGNQIRYTCVRKGGIKK